MEKSHETTNSEGVCKKIYHAIGSNCASGKSNRSASPPPPPEVASSVESVKVHIESVPITASNEGKLKPHQAGHQINGSRVGHVSVAIPNHPMISTHEHKSREGNHHENMYSDYITRMKNKMGILSTKAGVGGESPPTNNVKPANRLASTTGRRDSFNEKIVHFIKRGRKKIRDPSNFAED